jgi:hypothetical protein
MFAYSYSGGSEERAAQEAFDIAWNFVSRVERIADATVAQAFIATEIRHLLERGERHKLRLANLAILAFQRTHPGDRETALVARIF